MRYLWERVWDMCERVFGGYVLSMFYGHMTSYYIHIYTTTCIVSYFSKFDKKPEMLYTNVAIKRR